MAHPYNDSAGHQSQLRATCLSIETSQFLHKRKCLIHVKCLSVSVDAFAVQKDMKRLFGAEHYGRVNACGDGFFDVRGEFLIDLVIDRTLDKQL